MPNVLASWEKQEVGNFMETSIFHPPFPYSKCFEKIFSIRNFFAKVAQNGCAVVGVTKGLAFEHV